MGGEAGRCSPATQPPFPNHILSHFMKTLFACTLAAVSLLGLTACESDDVSPTIQTTTTTEETVQRPAAASATTETRTIRSY